MKIMDIKNGPTDEFCQWIKVSDRLPEKDCGVIGAESDIGWVGQMIFMGGIFYGEDFYGGLDKNPSVSHWMPLPKPPPKTN